MSLFHGNHYDTVWDGYYSLMTLAMSITTFILTSRVLVKNEKLNRTISIIGENTLGIYLIHGLFSKPFKPYFHDFLLSKSILVNIITAMALILSLLLTLLIKKTPIASRLLKF